MAAQTLNSHWEFLHLCERVVPLTSPGSGPRPWQCHLADGWDDWLMCSGSIRRTLRSWRCSHHQPCLRNHRRRQIWPLTFLTTFQRASMSMIDQKCVTYYTIPLYGKEFHSLSHSLSLSVSYPLTHPTVSQCDDIILTSCAPISVVKPIKILRQMNSLGVLRIVRNTYLDTLEFVQNIALSSLYLS